MGLCVMENYFVLGNGDEPENSRRHLCAECDCHAAARLMSRGRKPKDRDGHKHVLKASRLKFSNEK